MILITHPNLNNIAINYSKELYAKLEYRKGMIEKVLENIAGGLPHNFSPYTVTECLAALKASIDVSNLPQPPTGSSITDVLNHYIDQIRKANAGPVPAITDATLVTQRLQSIFGYNLQDFFSADISTIKSHNEVLNQRTQQAGLAQSMKDFFFEYTLYYEIINKHIGNELGIICCPYCNRNYITYILSEKNKRLIGPTYDHFFSKKDYGFASLCFFNLIPSCTICNSNLKHEIDFDLTTHLYPYRDEFGENACFDFNFSLAGVGQDSKIIFKPYIRLKDGISGEDKLKLAGIDDVSGKDKSGSIKVFRLSEIYESHHDTVEEVHEKFYVNSKHYVGSIEENLKLLGSGEKEFYRFHFNNYFDSSDFHKRPLAKLTRDIYNKLKKNQDTGPDRI